MKVSIILLVTGVLLLISSIFIGVLLIVRAFNQFDTGENLPGIFNYIPVVSVILGMILTTIGASNLSLRSKRK